MTTREKDARGRPRLVPERIRLTRHVRSEIPVVKGRDTLFAYKGEVHAAECNQFGAVAIRVDGELLGVKPGEFEVLEWTENEHYER